MISSEIGKHIDDEGNIVKVSLKVRNNDDVVRKHDIKIGSEYVINPVNPRKTKGRDRKVAVIKFVRDGKYPLQAQVKYLDTKRPGRVDIEDLDLIK